LKKLVGRVVEQQYKRLGWDPLPNEDENDTKLRSIIIALSLYGELPHALSTAEDRYKKGTIDTYDSELRTAIMANAVRRHVTPDVIDTLLTAYPKSTNSELRDDIASALTSAKDLPTLKRLIGTLKDTSFIRPQDFMHWFVWLLRNRYSREIMWQWTQDNWSWIVKTFKNDSYYDVLPRYIAGSLVTRQQMEEYKNFF